MTPRGAVVTPTRLTPWARSRGAIEHTLRRLCLTMRERRLRHQLAAAEFDLRHLPQDIADLQQLLEFRRLHADALRVQIEDCRLARLH